MSVSPPPEDIDINTPPDSPNNIGIISLPSSPSNNVLAPTESPQKRTRPLMHRKTKRRRVVGANVLSTPGTPGNKDKRRDIENGEDLILGILGEIAAQDEFAEVGLDPRMEVDVDVDSNPDVAIDLDSDCFDDYMDLVLADCADFYQILPTLFVVQGWDGAQLTVSVEL